MNHDITRGRGSLNVAAAKDWLLTSGSQSRVYCKLFVVNFDIRILFLLLKWQTQKMKNKNEIITYNKTISKDTFLCILMLHGYLIQKYSAAYFFEEL